MISSLGEIVLSLFKILNTQDYCNELDYLFFPKVENRKKISVKVWERGAGLTKACGSAACATAFAAKINNLTDSDGEIGFELGNLSIKVDDKNFVKMKGPVSDIKKIEIKL